MHRACAVVLVCFLLASSARGLFPQFCLTLSSFAVESASDTQMAAQSCCAEKSSSSQESSEKPNGENPSCAFCKVVKAVFTTSPFVICPIPQDYLSSPDLNRETPGVERLLDKTSLGRAPPTSA